MAPNDATVNTAVSVAPAAVAQLLTLRALLALPPVVQRRLVGEPVVRDGQRLGVENQLLQRLTELADQPDVSTLPVDEARARFAVTSAAGGGRQKIGAVHELTVADLPARLYRPRSVEAGETSPLLVFFHGGGFMHGGVATYDPACRHLAERSGVRVLSVEYRLAPEHVFPAAHDDALAAYAWALEHAAELGADPARIGVAGDSAGGTLAAATALEAARRGWTCALQLLVYPAVDSVGRGSRRSSALFGEGFFLTRDYIDLADRSYLADPAQRADPRLSPVLLEADDLPDGLAPALVVTAGFDPLRDEGEAWARLVAEAGVEVQMVRYPEQVHGFFNLVGVGREARAACAEIATRAGAALRR